MHATTTAPLCLSKGNSHFKVDLLKSLVRLSTHSQNYFCVSTGINKGTFSAWLNKERALSSQQLGKIVASLNLSELGLKEGALYSFKVDYTNLSQLAALKEVSEQLLTDVKVAVVEVDTYSDSLKSIRHTLPVILVTMAQGATIKIEYARKVSRAQPYESLWIDEVKLALGLPNSPCEDVIKVNRHHYTKLIDNKLSKAELDMLMGGHCVTWKQMVLLMQGRGASQSVVRIMSPYPT